MDTVGFNKKMCLIDVIIFEKILEKFGFEKEICNENKEKKKISQTQNFILSQNDWF